MYLENKINLKTLKRLEPAFSKWKEMKNILKASNFKLKIHIFQIQFYQKYQKKIGTGNEIIQFYKSSL